MRSVLCTTLIGREAEADALEVALAAPTGEPVLVLGQAGVGKSRLVRNARVRARKGERSCSAEPRIEGRQSVPPRGRARRRS